MFVLDLSETYLWPVTFELASSKKNAKAGDTDKHSFEVEFKRLTETEIKDLYVGDGKDDADILRRFVVGWRKVMASPSEEIPFSTQALEMVIEKAPGVSNAIARAFFNSIVGAKTKN